jgi:hypothetical protein
VFSYRERDFVCCRKLLILLYRYGLAAYHITSEDGTTAVAGTLVVSNEQADR